MIGYLSGRVDRNNNGQVLLIMDNIGYVVNTPYSEILDNSKVEFFVYTHVRDSEISLYGFREWSEKVLFEKLIGVSGVGPKSAMNLLSSRSVEEIVSAVLQNNPSVLKVTGIGPKTTQKIILELKGKVDEFNIKEGGGVFMNIESSVREEAFEALLGLGYSPREINSALEEVTEEHKESTGLIKNTLVYLKRHGF